MYCWKVYISLTLSSEDITSGSNSDVDVEVDSVGKTLVDDPFTPASISLFNSEKSDLKILISDVIRSLDTSSCELSLDLKASL